MMIKNFLSFNQWKMWKVIKKTNWFKTMLWITSYLIMMYWIYTIRMNLIDVIVLCSLTNFIINVFYTIGWMDGMEMARNTRMMMIEERKLQVQQTKESNRLRAEELKTLKQVKNK